VQYPALETVHTRGGRCDWLVCTMSAGKGTTEGSAPPPELLRYTHTLCRQVMSSLVEVNRPLARGASPTTPIGPAVTGATPASILQLSALTRTTSRPTWSRDAMTWTNGVSEEFLTGESTVLGPVCGFREELPFPIAITHDFSSHRRQVANAQRAALVYGKPQSTPRVLVCYGSLLVE